MAREPADIAAKRVELGERLAVFRKAADITQGQLASRAFVDRTTVAHIEKGRTRGDERFWRAVDEITGAEGALLTAYGALEAAKAEREAEARKVALAHARQLADSYRSAPESAGPSRKLPPGNHFDPLVTQHPSRATLPADAGALGRSEVDDVKRMEFVAGLLATLTAPGSLLPTSMRLGMGDIRRYNANLEQLYELDDTYGASDEVYSLTVRTLKRLLRDFNQASYSPSVGQEIRSIAGQLMEHAGWLAFDSGRAGDARCWWLEALHTSRMASGNAEVEVVVLASLSANASRAGRGREAVDLAVAAQRIAAKINLPRLNSLLSAREALGHARSGDSVGATKALAQARKSVESERREVDPLWLDFWDASDLASHEATAARYLDDLPNAEVAARHALATVNTEKFPRNHAMYLARLGHILANRGAVDEAVQLTASAALQAVELHSHRLIVDVESSLHALSRHRDHSAARELVDYLSTRLQHGRSS